MTTLQTDVATPHPDDSPISPQESKEKLEKLMQSRSTEEELLAQHVLHAPHSLAPGLVAKQEELKRSQLEDSLSNALQRRPTTEEMVSKGLLEKDEAPRTEMKDQIEGDAPAVSPGGKIV